jgi:hypothetical protein
MQNNSCGVHCQCYLKQHKILFLHVAAANIGAVKLYMKNHNSNKKMSIWQIAQESQDWNYDNGFFKIL